MMQTTFKKQRCHPTTSETSDLSDEPEFGIFWVHGPPHKYAIIYSFDIFM